MKRIAVPGALLVVVTMVAGCGSGGSSSSSLTPSTSSVSAISGKVADGYLVNATVFMDKNGNYQLDAGEPSTTTDANGAYTLNVDAADVGKYPVVAVAIKDVTIETDSNKAVSSSFLLSLPKDAVSGTVSSNFISPMSSELREMMETGKYATMQQAMEALRAKLGMPMGTEMLADYLSGQNTPMHTAAQNMAALMGGQMSRVFTGGSATSIDVNRYRGMMGTIFSNMSSIRGANSQGAMGTLMSSMMSGLGNIPAGMPFRNMSASFRGMMGGAAISGGMGGYGGGSMGGPGTVGSMMGR